jgi:hypothetical protein
MYGKFLYALGIAFILFMVAMFLGIIFRSGFSGIFRILLSRFLMILFISTVLFAVGIVISSLYSGVGIMETFESVYNLFLEKIKEF